MTKKDILSGILNDDNEAKIEIAKNVDPNGIKEVIVICRDRGDDDKTYSAIITRLNGTKELEKDITRKEADELLGEKPTHHVVDLNND